MARKRTIWAQGSGGAVFELDVNELVEAKLKSGELVEVDPPKKPRGKAREAEPKPQADVDAEPDTAEAEVDAEPDTAEAEVDAEPDTAEAEV